MITIRPARYDDILDIAIPEHELPFALHDLLHQAEAGLLIVAEDGGYICGVLALGIHHWPWNRQQGRFLTNHHFFVEQEYRKGGTAQKLIEAAKVVARARDLPLRIDLMGAGDRETKDRFMQMMGFTYLGGQFYFEGGE
jgi:GNAT superfamily N-acetyltransferase